MNDQVSKDEPTIAIGLGEVLWDCFPDEERPGGAPANFAFHCEQLGFQGIVCSRVGNDDLGKRYLEHLRRNGLLTEFVLLDEKYQTGRVDVTLDEEKQPTYTFVEDVAWDHLVMTDAIEKLLENAEVICFGTLAQRSSTSRKMIHQCLSIAKDARLRIYDVNLREPWYDFEWIDDSIRLANVIKLNEEEAQMLGKHYQCADSDVEAIAKMLLEKFELELIAVTLGSEGSCLVTSKESVRVGADPVEVIDPVGAGDSFTAAVARGYLAGLNLDEVAKFANRVAGFVASHAGAMPTLDEELKKPL